MQHYLRVLLAALVTATYPSFILSADSFEEILTCHLARYPEMQAEDVYKLIFQGCMGPGHYGASEAGFLKHLEEEAADLGDDWGGDSVMIEPLEGDFLRLHLRPYLKAGGKLKDLAAALSQSILIPVNKERFYQILDNLTIGNSEKYGLKQFEKELERLSSEAHSKENPPTVSHSKQYHIHYNPHYRIITREEAQKLLELVTGGR